MEENNLFIKQQNKEEDLYIQLQKKTLEEIQRLSGKIWTDFNSHDPGITTADIANFVLTEFDYKLGFNLHDYLTDEKSCFIPEKYGMFLPEKVYPTAPVTLDDYQKLLLSEFPSLDKVNVSCDIKKGNYNIKVELSPFEASNPNLEKDIRKYFNAHRNLCEKLNSVTIYTPPLLYLHSELEIFPGGDASSILAQVYWEIIQYLSGSIKVEYPEERMFSKLSPEEWFEGTTKNVRITIPKQRNSAFELHKLLLQIEGVKSFKTCHLVENDSGRDVIRTDFRKGYSVYIPKHQSEFYVKINIDNSEIPINTEYFIEELQALYFSKKTSRSNARQEGISKAVITPVSIPEGVYRDVFGHYSITKDFPKCYQVDTENQNAKPNQFEAYLKLYDLLICRGLAELSGLKKLCSIEKNETGLCEMEILNLPDKNLYKHNDCYRDVTKIKNIYLDFLDHLYGIDSNPPWMSEFSFYGESENERIKRRMRLLANVPYLTQTRSKAWNIYEEQSINNIATIKAHLSYLLDLNMDESISVGNILPSHNLILLDGDNDNKQWRDKLNSMLVNEKMMDSTNIEKIIPDSPFQTDEEKSLKYLELRRDLPIFNSNLICGGLFRWGLNLDNYKLVRLENQEYLLAFWNQEDNVWMNLGRLADKQKLNEWANTLCRYLMELNRQCEVVYLVEHNLLYPPLPFTVSFVFSSWTTRFRSPRLREICMQLISSLLPAHIKAHIYWLDVSEMQYFEENYRKWSKAMSEDCPQSELEVLQKGMLDILEVKTKKM